MFECEMSGDGTRRWFKNGRYHRENGPAIEYSNGHAVWCIDGLPHRIGGPAIVQYDGTKAWYQNGSLHREDGPAVEFPDGGKEWWLDDDRYTKEEYVLLQFSKGIIINE